MINAFQSNALSLLLGVSFILNSCAPAKQLTTEVQSLNSNQKAYVQALIESGKVPDPDQVIPSDVSNSCQDFIKSLPSDYLRDTMLVPENKNDPNSPMIQIFYYGKIFSGKAPVVFFNGGPGSDSHSSFRILSDKLKAKMWFQKISFIYIDQRGNGCSSPYPQGSDDATLERLKFYGSRQIVDDAEALRVKLIGDRPWKAFGQSYGAFIVHRYATLYPSKLTAAYAHAGVITSSPLERLKGRILSQERVMKIYLQQYPEDEASLRAINTYLSGKCFKDEASSASGCGLYVIDDFGKFLGFTDEWPRIHKWIQVVVPKNEVDEVGLKKYLQTIYFSNEVDPKNNKSAAKAVIDFVDRNVLELTHENCAMIGVDLANSLLNECKQPLLDAPRLLSPRTLKIQSFAQDFLTLADFKSTLQSSALKFHLYSGENDTFVPKEIYPEELEATKGLVIYTHFMKSGHDGFYTESQVWDDVRK